MLPEAITADAIEEALRAIRSSRPLRASPLVDLVALGHQVAAEGLADTREARIGLLPRWLEALASNQLARLRGRAIGGDGAPRASEAQLTQLTDDFLAHSVEREAWGILCFRYFAGSSYTLGQLASLLGVTDKTLRRRILRGYEALAGVLVDLERAASTGRRRGNAVPEELSPFIGREAELAAIRRLLTGHRLVTLTGPGGMGKSRLATRLARELALDFADGAWFVELSGLGHDRQVPRAVVSAFGLREQPGRTPTEVVVDFLVDKRLLLVLDDCEHLARAVSGLVRSVLEGCPRVQVLATSREELYVDGQALFPVPPMALPEATDLALTDRVQHSDAVRLFTRRATAARPDFALDEGNGQQVARLCIQLDGIPLAIELAAARARFLTLDQLEARLADRFSLLQDGRHAVRPGHETLRATLDSSYGLLARAERLLLARLSVFRAGWSLEAAEAVCSGSGVAEGDVLELLSRLASKSLLVVRHATETARYHYFETIREYAADRLDEAGETAALEDRHLAYYVELAEASATGLHTPEQLHWLRRIGAEEENIGAALRRARTPKRIEQGLRLANALMPYWFIRGRHTEALGEFRALLAIEAGAATGAPYAQALTCCGGLMVVKHEGAAAESMIEEAVIRWRALGDRRGVARALHRQAYLCLQRGETHSARRLFDHCVRVHRARGEVFDLANALFASAGIHASMGDGELARRQMAEVHDIVRRLGDKNFVASILEREGLEAFALGDYEAADRKLQECLEIHRALEDRAGAALDSQNLGNVCFVRGDFAGARRYFDESLAFWREIGDRSGVALAQGGLGEVYLATGAIDEAAPRLEAFLADARRVGDIGHLRDALELWAQLETARGRPEIALQILGANERSRLEGGIGPAAYSTVVADRLQEAARASLDDQSVDRAYETGRGLSIEETAACALGARPWPFSGQGVALDGARPAEEVRSPTRTD